jgi:hypothetical protein
MPYIVEVVNEITMSDYYEYETLQDAKRALGTIAKLAKQQTEEDGIERIVLDPVYFEDDAVDEPELDFPEWLDTSGLDFHSQAS